LLDTLSLIQCIDCNVIFQTITEKVRYILLNLHFCV
jgi:hypothetical protein